MPLTVSLFQWLESVVPYEAMMWIMSDLPKNPDQHVRDSIVEQVTGNLLARMMRGVARRMVRSLT